jgi:formiminotetrahydrofolate cyclodeaminase
MAANFADGREDVFARAGQLRTRALELAEIELHAYEPVLEALRLPRDDPNRSERIETAKREASQSPLEVAGVAAEVAELAAGLAHEGNEHLAGDAIVGTLLADAAAQGAARLVAINLSDAPEVTEAAEFARRAHAARQQALA